MVNSIYVTGEPDERVEIVHKHEFKNINYDIVGNLFKNQHFILKNQTPQAWIESSKHLQVLFPVYIYQNLNGEKILISYYLRQLILWEKFDINKLKNKFDVNGVMYICTDQVFESCEMNYNNMLILIEWLYEVMIELRDIYLINYLSSMNSLILDITMASIINFNIPYSKYQSTLIMTIYNVIKSYNENIVNFRPSYSKPINFSNLKDFLIDICCGAGFWCDEICTFQENIIKNKIEMFSDI
jgi:hypothetical protein